MIRYSCTSCQRTLLIKPSLAGQSSKCPCGASFTVPQIAKPAAPTGISSSPAAGGQPAAEASSSVVVGCTKCDRQLRAPATAAGKAVRCTCGQLVMVPSQDSPDRKSETKRGSTVVSVVKNEPGGDWLNQLPPPQPVHTLQPQNGAEFWYVDVEPEDYQPPPPVTVPDARQQSHEYIRGAEKELREQRQRGQSDGSLGTAQVTLVLVGLLTIAINGFLFFNATNEVQQVMKDGNVAMSQESLLRFVQIIYGAFIAVGTLMIILGALIYQFPVFCPIAGLVLYISGMVVGAVIDPMTLLKGIIIKVLVIVALAKAVGDGASYRD